MIREEVGREETLSRGKIMESTVSVPRQLLILLAVVLVGIEGTIGSDEPWLKSKKQGELGTEVQLPCVLKLPQCGGLHSIKWYRDATRIFIFSESVGLTRGNNDIAARADMIYDTNNTNTYLRIPDVKLEDEGLYKCEATYLAVNRECNNVQHISLTVTLRPEYARVIDENTKTILSSGTTLGPVNEGTMISLSCESAKAKPIPVVEWYKGDQQLQDTNSSNIEENGVGIGISQLQMLITRNELGAVFTCRVSNEALEEPLTVHIKLDVHVRPLKMDLNGVVGHVVQGTKILLQCIVSAARPAANVTWYNGTDLLNDENERFEKFETKVAENEDGTSETTSYLAFTASEHDNGKTFSCHAENAVTRVEGIKPMEATTTIEVLYPPIVTMSPLNITVNETSDFLILCEYVANPASLVKVKWLRDDEELDLDTDHFEGGITEQTALRVRNATRNDCGVYKCVLENSVGESDTEDLVDVSVLFTPTVKVMMEPETPVNEADRLNVSLTCEVTSGNPTTLTAVRWYLDGDLLKELPDCSRNITSSWLGTTTTEESFTFCDIDPSKLLLEAVGRSFHGNYSCEGRNDAGWGPLSSSTPVIVYYKPGPASISYEPEKVIKKGPLTITCSVKDPGRPKVLGYKWFRGLHRLPDENGSKLHIESVNLETEANFTCLAYNDAGDGESDTVFVDVSAPPAFIKNLPPYLGYVYNSPNISIECWVDCSPICNISWLKDGTLMDFSKSNNRYYVINVNHPPNYRTSDFESIQSILIWNLTAWPNGELDRVEDNGMYTCESDGNGIGPGVKSSTHFHVEFPPENLTISHPVINVTVDHIPGSVNCSAKAHPEPNFRWYREGSTESIYEGATLDFQMPVPRRSNGTYYCEARNRHGTRKISTTLNVQFKPECKIERERIKGVDHVVCSAVANPEKSDFVWSLKSDNDTLEEVPVPRDGKSYLVLDSSVSNFRTYVCVANNTIGFSSPCERNIPGNIPWWLRLEGDVLIIVIIIAVVIILVVIIICIVIYVVCRRKRNQGKYSKRVVELEEREHPEGGPPSPSVSSHSGGMINNPPTPAPRWPLKPGVLVHVNREHSLRSGLGLPDFAGKQPQHQRHDQISSAKAPVKALRRRKNVDGNCLNVGTGTTGTAATSATTTSTVTNDHCDEGMLARANKIRAIFSAQLKEHDTFPGISREKTAVTYKRIVPRQRILHDVPSVATRDQAAATNISRKRKKPGADPGQTANNNHVDSVSEGLPDSGTKTFYENLPFHGLQPPPNKLASPKFARVTATTTTTTTSSTSSSALHGTLHSSASSPCSSRPLSRATSLCNDETTGGGASSGYESTRSHLGPHYSCHNMPRNNSPPPKCNSLKPRRRKQHKRFYSLRVCQRHQRRGAAANSQHSNRRSYELYAIPLGQQSPDGSMSTVCPHKEDTRSLRLDDTEDAHDADDDEKRLLGLSLPPVPAPRVKTKLSEHTYQNVPSPVFPRTDFSSSRIKTDMMCNYKEHYQQQQQQHHRQEMQQYSYPSSSCSSQLTLPLTRSLYHHSSIISPLQTSLVHPNDRQSLNHHSRENNMTASASVLPRQSCLDGEDHDFGSYQNSAGGRRHANNTLNSTTSSVNRRNERRKYRNKHLSNEQRKKQRRDFSIRRDQETSFHQIGLPDTTYKISYPHYYEDEIIAQCPTANNDYYQPSVQRGPDDREYLSSGPINYIEQQPPVTTAKNRKIGTGVGGGGSSSTSNGNKSKRRSSNPDLRASAASIMQYAELHFRDVGREIDV